MAGAPRPAAGAGATAGGGNGAPPAGTLPASIADNLAAVRHRMTEAARRAGRPADAVTLVAVSKTQPPQAVQAALAAGQRIFGENRVQEALAKMDAVGDGPLWHLIGHLQTNKAKWVPGRFDTVQTLDSERLAQALDTHAHGREGPLKVLLQLNLTREATKSGVADWDALCRLLESVRRCTSLLPTGLMTLPDPALSESETRAHFAQVRGMLERVRRELDPGPAFRELSMGMSHDFEWAIEEGATLVRVGTAIFGQRPG
jgi:hypothetical protein